MNIRNSAAALALALSTAASAQLPTLDIALYDMGNSTLEVRVRPDLDFNGVFASSVFAIRWDAASGASLGNESQPVDVIPYHSVNKSGPEVDDNGFRYQPFAGFGFSSLQDEGVQWLAGIEYTLCTIPVVNGTSLFQIVMDPWTASNNADYYASLNGSNQTGIIYGNPSLMIEGTSSTGTVVNLQPNPASNSTQLTLGVVDMTDVEVRLVDPSGRAVWQKNYPALVGRQQETIDLVGLGAGTYLLRVTSAGGTQVHRLVVQ